MKTERKAFAKLFKRICIILCAFAMAAVFCSFPATAETTYVISGDGDEIVVRTEEADAEAVVRDAGVELKDEDYIEISEDKAAGYIKLDVIRAKTVIVRRGGEETVYRTNCGTVGEFLASRGIRTAQNCELGCGYSDEIFDGRIITIRDVMYVEETVTETIEPKLLYVYDNSMAADEKALIIGEKAGSREVTYRKKIVDGLVYKCEAISETILEEPVDGLYSTGDKSIATLSTAHADTKTLNATNGGEYSYDRVENMIATAYTHSGRLTATGRVARVGIVAADTSVIPFGTLVYITGADGSWTYGYALVGDTGVKDHILDLFMDTYDECIQHGARKALVYIVDTDK